MRFLTLPKLLLVAVSLLVAEFTAEASRVTINSDQVLVVDGKKVFPIGFSIPPPWDGKTPEGKPALREMADAGAMFVRTGADHDGWDGAALKRQTQWLNAAARHGMYCWPYLQDLASLKPGDDAREKQLREVITRFKNHPGLLVWKGVDEPEWGKHPVAPLLHARDVIRELDPNHPVVIIQAPRGTVETLRPYNAAGDITGMDIYPVSYPPGTHSLLTNKTLSLVGDHTRIIMDAADGQMPVWIVLQIAWSGVVNPGKTLRFPTLPEERFMTYQAIINGARGLIYFGGGVKTALNPRDAKLGWNWTFWQRVLRPVIEEIGGKSLLQPALVAPNSKLPVKVRGANDVEFCVREADGHLFLLACKTGGATVKVEFSGLPTSVSKGEVMFESPRAVEAKNGTFTDWFAPYEVHVYRFKQ